MNFLAAFFLGLAGSLHCAAMCGPLALAAPAGGHASLSRLIYNAGRIAVYAALGAVFGFIGHTLAFAGWQRALSIGIGSIILAGMIFSMVTKRSWPTPFTRALYRFKSLWARLFQRRTAGAIFLLGGLNGLLPCGLVYVAAAMAAASGQFLTGITVMIAFGLGTLPMLLGIGLVKSIPSLSRRLQSNRIVACCVILAGVMLVLRGLSLGIPYLSPHLSSMNEPICGH